MAKDIMTITRSIVVFFKDNRQYERFFDGAGSVEADLLGQIDHLPKLPLLFRNKLRKRIDVVLALMERVPRKPLLLFDLLIKEILEFDSEIPDLEVDRSLINKLINEPRVLSKPVFDHLEDHDNNATK